LDHLEGELHELSGDMQVNVKLWTHDFMNLVFGKSEENEQFIKTVVLPEVAQYYQVVIPEQSQNYTDYPLEELLSYPLRLNALYFALTDLMGIKCLTVEVLREDKTKETNTKANR
jgi:hypothetical protein